MAQVARVVSDAMKAGAYSDEESEFDLHVRRVIALVESIALEAQGNLRRPRLSEVRLPPSVASESRATRRCSRTKRVGRFVPSPARR
jgi:hypothetical protein